jgi:hypothetical protein
MPSGSLVPSGLSTSGANGPSASTTSDASIGPSAVAIRQRPSARRSEPALPDSSTPPSLARCAAQALVTASGLLRLAAPGQRTARRKTRAGWGSSTPSMSSARYAIPNSAASFELAFGGGERCIAAIELEPAVAAPVAQRPGIRQQGLVLCQCARKQRTRDPRGLRPGAAGARPRREPTATARPAATPSNGSLLPGRA